MCLKWRVDVLCWRRYFWIGFNEVDLSGSGVLGKIHVLFANTIQKYVYSLMLSRYLDNFFLYIK